MHTKEATMLLSASGTTLTYLGMRSYQLDLEGRFTPGWTCELSHGLAERKISIMRVKAARSLDRADD